MSIDDATPEEWNEVNMNSEKKEEGTWTTNLIADVVNETCREINNPSHYNSGDVECIDGIEASLSKEEFEGYLHGNIIKYVWRFKYKGGVKDLQKAEWYLKKLMGQLTK
mgnify:FL=1|tara:strand:- start:1168 stop:1494 length:327 start_codon:yes stop_codon:yes gene_type:complete